MSTISDGQLADAVRVAFRNLPEKHRATIFKKAAPFRHKTTANILHGAHIPPTFQPERMSFWLRPEQRRKMEEVVLSPQHEEWLDGILRAFFCEAHPEVNNCLLEQLESSTNPMTFEEALAGIPAKFPNEPFMDLYMACIRWVCQERIGAHDEQVREFRQKLGSTNAPAAENSGNRTPVAPDNSVTTTAVSSIGKLAEFDAHWQQLSKAIEGIRNLKPCDIDALTANTKAAQQIADGLVSQLQQMATETGQPMPVWTTRDEFSAAWTQLTAAVDTKRSAGEKIIKFKSAVADSLQSVHVRHRLPKKQAQLCELARRAAAEVRDTSLGIEELRLGGPSDSGEWLKWLWSMEGTVADETHAKLQIQLPVLAELIIAVGWNDLEWTAAPAKFQPQTAPAPAMQSPAPAVSEPKIPAPVSTPVPPAPVGEQPVTKNIPPSATQKSPEPQKPAPAKVQAAVIPKTQAAPAPSALPPSESKQPGLIPAHPLPVSTPVAKAVIPQSQSAAVSIPPVLPVTPPTSAPPLVVDTKKGSDPLSPACWSLADQGRWGLASHIAAIDASGQVPPGWVFEAAALGPRVSYEVSSISSRLTEIFLNSADFSLDGIAAEIRPATRLVLAAAALRPALLAPQSNAASVLKLVELKETLKLPALDAIVEAIAEFGLHRQPLHPVMLQSSHDRADWDKELALVRLEIREWIEKAPHRSFNFSPASRIWRDWVGPGGVLLRLLEQTANADSQSLGALESALKPWRVGAEKLVQVAMKGINQRKPVVGSARDALIARIGEAVDFANRTFALLSQIAEQKTDFRGEQIRNLLDACHARLPAARQELSRMQSNGAGLPIRAAVRLFSDALTQMEVLLGGEIPIPGSGEPDPRWLVDAELLRDVGFPLGQEGHVLPPVPADQDRLIALATAAPDWPEAWKRQVIAENHAATSALLEFFRTSPPAGMNLEECRLQRDRELQESRRKLEVDSDATRQLLDEFVKLALCREQDYLDWSAEVERIKQEAGLETTNQFGALHAGLVRVRGAIHQAREKAAAKVSERLAAAKDIPAEIHGRIASLITAGDVHTATDYLDRAICGGALPGTAAHASPFLEFFGDKGWLTRTDGDFKKASFTDCWQAARSHATWLGLDFSTLGEEQRTDAARHLELWLSLERTRKADDKSATQLVAALGLQPLSVRVGMLRSGRHPDQRCEVKAEKINEREASVVASFGSDAKGSYTVHFVWGEPSPDDLVTLCKRETGDTSAHIVICFRYLSAPDRRELADVARRRFLKAVVVDRALFAFVCAQTSPRFATVLRCALPFSRVEPYSISAGAVPAEIFYGRRRELESLADPRGSCFVYGGRQLGKTALLRALEKNFHHPDKGRVSVFVDLKSELFSRGQPVDGLWSLLVNRFREINVFDAKVGASAGQEALFRHIREWLEAVPERRILLLLDEADTFLEQDSKETSQQRYPFPRCQLLKRLMESTESRFKVVFAGLHNVQRTTRVSNHPLAHFGETICVGPMLEEAESREARALVEEPLAAAGYFFQSSDAVSRILALTNYYPSLIQLFCFHLLNDLREHHAARFTNSRMTPPCQITSAHVQAAYGSRVRQAIHDKINLTLHLDSRYELIACLLASHHAHQTGTDGVDLRTIRDDAALYWPAGFNEMRSDDEFRALLEEMVGLGIIRQVSGTNRFGLRNPNVMMLLGTEEEIERRLDGAKSWELPIRYEADKFRRVVVEPPRLLFSPLTAQSEGELKAQENRVAILYGVPAAGLENVQIAMESETLFGKSRTLVFRDSQSAQALVERISTIKREPPHTLLIVPQNISWDETWVAAAANRLLQFTSKDAFITVLFIADMARAALVMPGLDGAKDTGVRELSLRPWHDEAVRQWLQDLNLGDDKPMRARIRQVSGNWPMLLMQLTTSSKADLLKSCVEMEKRTQQKSEALELLPAFGLAGEAPNSPLCVAADSGRFNLAWVYQYLDAKDDSARQKIAERITLAEKLGLIGVFGGDLEFDPLAARILLKAHAAA